MSGAARRCLAAIRYMEYVAVWEQIPPSGRARYRVVWGIWGSCYLTLDREPACR